MKRVVLSLLLSVSFIFAKEYSIFFGNGINTTKQEARIAKDAIKTLYLLKHPEHYQKIKRWDIVYNHTHGMGIDLYESALQKIDEHLTTEMIWFTLDLLDYSIKGVIKRGAMKLAGKELAKKLAKKVSEKIIFKYVTRSGDIVIKGVRYTKEEFEKMLTKKFEEVADDALDAYLSYSEDDINKEREEDYKRHFATYVNEAKKDRKIIVIAHSQGNLFINEAYSLMEDHPVKFWKEDTAWVREYITALGIASPADNILEMDEPHITFDNDIITLVPNSLDWNIRNPTRYYLEKNALGEIAEDVFSLEAHSFLQSYMREEITRTKILDFISDEIDKASDEDKESNNTLNPPTLEGGVNIVPIEGGFRINSQEAQGLVDRYEFYRSTTAGELGEMIYSGSVNSYEDIELTDGITYYYTAKACNDAGCATSKQDYNTYYDNSSSEEKICAKDYFSAGEITEFLKKGDQDGVNGKTQVEELQSYLYALGIELDIDGIFGSGTEAAVKEFQQAKGIAVDGQVGPKTREKINDPKCNSKIH